MRTIKAIGVATIASLVMFSARGIAQTDDDLEAMGMESLSKRHMAAVKQVDEYYEQKKILKSQHSDWSSEQIARFVICNIGLKMTVRKIVEEDDRDKMIADSQPLCEVYAAEKSN